MKQENKIMKDNTQEKNLIEKNENNIFGKIKNFFRKIFGKKEDTLKSDKEEIVNNKPEKNEEFKEFVGHFKSSKEILSK